ARFLNEPSRARGKVTRAGCVLPRRDVDLAAQLVLDPSVGARSAMQARNRWPLTFLAVAGLAALDSCAGSGDHSVEGNVTFAITDGASDAIESFTVDVTSLQVATAVGASVSVISTPTRIDLASLSDLSEIISHKTLPAGLYTQAEITLDFTNASCML